MSKENWNKIKVLHNKANDLMKKQAILNKDIEIKFRVFTKKKPNTKIYQTIKKQIENMKTKSRKLSAQITDTLRKKDSLLKGVK